MLLYYFIVIANVSMFYCGSPAPKAAASPLRWRSVHSRTALQSYDFSGNHQNFSRKNFVIISFVATLASGPEPDSVSLRASDPFEPVRPDMSSEASFISPPALRLRASPGIFPESGCKGRGFAPNSQIPEPKSLLFNTNLTFVELSPHLSRILFKLGIRNANKAKRGLAKHGFGKAGCVRKGLSGADDAGTVFQLGGVAGDVAAVAAYDDAVDGLGRYERRGKVRMGTPVRLVPFKRIVLDDDAAVDRPFIYIILRIDAYHRRRAIDETVADNRHPVDSAGFVPAARIVTDVDRGHGGIEEGIIGDQSLAAGGEQKPARRSQRETASDDFHLGHRR